MCVVTGASAGIGLETARGLAARGAEVALVGRNPERTHAVARALGQQTGNDRVRPWLADFSSLRDVRRLAAELLAHHPAIHVLVNNAGVWHLQRRSSHDGFDDTLAVNHLAPFLLTNLLLERLLSSAPARVVHVASRLHDRARFVDLEQIRRPLGYDLFAHGVYAQSKLANLLFSAELSRRLEGTAVTSNALHPGDVATTVVRDSRLLSLAIILGRLFLDTPAEGARTSLHLATAPELSGVSGRYFVACQSRPPAAAAQDADAAARLWQVSAELCGIPERSGWRAPSPAGHFP